MADTDEPKKKDVDEPKKQEEPKAEATDEKAPASGILPWIVLAAVVVVFAGAGFGLGRLLASLRTPGTAQASGQDNSSQRPQSETDVPDLTGGGSENSWYYDLEPVVANLDVPGVTRYVRATLTLEINSEVDKKKGTAFLDEKKPILTNWLTIYLASLNLENTRGDRNLKRIQTQILDAFNAKLFPDAKSQIKGVLFKEFAIQ